MIVKGSTTVVNFFVIGADGFPATGKSSSITANISINGASPTTFSGTISERDSTNAPGWYTFEYTFNTVGNVFITFDATDCSIAPWEEEVCEINLSGLDKLDSVYSSVLNWAVANNTLTLYGSGNTVLATFNLTRDSSGNIISVRPTA